MTFIYKIAIPSFLALILIILSVALLQKRFIGGALSREEFLRINETVGRITLEYLKADNFKDPFSPSSQKQFKDFSEELQRPSIARLTIWNRNQVIVFSDLKSVIGFHSPDHQDLQRLFAEEKPFFVKKKEETNEPVQSEIGEFQDIYIPIRISGKVVGAVEIHSVIAGILAPIEMYISNTTYILVATSGLILTLVLVVVFRQIAENKRAEEAVSASEERYRSVAQSAPDAIVLADGSGNIVGWNRRAEAAFGYTEEQVLGKPLTLLMPERYRGGSSKGAAGLLLTGESKVIGRTVELEGLRKDGSEFPLELSLSTWDAAGGKFYTGIIRDITERKQAERALQEAETRYRTLFEASPSGILVIDPETTLPIDFNPTAHRQLGYSREEFAKLRISDYEVIEKPQETRARIEKIVREGRDDFETKHRTKQGEIRDVFVTVQIIELSGRPVFHCIFWDITDLRRAGQKIDILREVDRAITSTLEPKVVLTLLLEKIETLLPYSAAAVLLLNKVTGELEPEAVWNISEQTWKEHITRIRSGGFLGKRILETRTPLAIANLHTDPRPVNPEFFRQEGLVSYIGIPLIAKDQPLGILSIYSKAEHEFSNEEVEFLTTLAGQAAVAIHNAELYEETTKLASDLSRSNSVKDEFLSVMSHELRTPLNVVMGYAGMMKDGLLGDVNPRQEEALGKILGRANDQVAMISNILFATAIDAAKIPAERQAVILAELFNDLESAYQAQATGPDLTLNWDCPPDLPILETDRDKLKQILQNLINNAIKFTEKGKVSVSARHDPKAKTIEFQVADTGVGIPHEMTPAIFEKFRQVDSSETRPYGGVGMGLYIVKKFTELLGGKVEVESAVGKGSTFTVTIPSNISNQRSTVKA